MEQKNKDMNELHSRIANVACKITALVLTASTVAALSACKKNSEHNQNNGTNSGYTDEQRKYSELLEEVLNDPYYTQCISKAMKNPEYRKSAVFDSHPYAFLESQGYDVNAIMNGEQECRTVSYELEQEPNNLYMFVRVVDGDAYCYYLLKYKLTEQEMKDYKTMHLFYIENGLYRCHFSAFFLNDKISELKTPEIVGTSKIVKKTTDLNMANYPKHLEDHPSSACDYAILNFNPEDKTFKFLMIPRLSLKACTESYLVDGNYYNRSYKVFYEDGALALGFDYNAIRKINSTNRRITYFNTQDYINETTNTLPEEYQ